MTRPEKNLLLIKFLGFNNKTINFDTDWNFLMKVVRRVYDLEPDSDAQTPIKDMTESLLDVDIEKTFNYAVLSVKYLNEYYSEVETKIL
jgi:hypothetical protein